MVTDTRENMNRAVLSFSANVEGNFHDGRKLLSNELTHSLILLKTNFPLSPYHLQLRTLVRSYRVRERYAGSSLQGSERNPKNADYIFTRIQIIDGEFLRYRILMRLRG